MPNIRVACWGTVINNKNEVLLIKRKGKDKWETPGGKLEAGESFKECLIREIKEETNVDIIPEFLLLVEQIYESSHWVCIGYLCRYKSGEAKILEEEKHENVCWFRLNNLPSITEYTKRAVEKYLREKSHKE